MAVGVEIEEGRVRSGEWNVNHSLSCDSFWRQWNLGFLDVNNHLTHLQSNAKQFKGVGRGAVGRGRGRSQLMPRMLAF